MKVMVKILDDKKGKVGGEVGTKISLIMEPNNRGE